MSVGVQSLHGRTRAGLPLVCLAVSACVYPLPIDEAPLSPNYPPFYEARFVSPDPSREVAYDPATGDAALVFSVPVVGDDNVEDRLFWRWYIDYDANFEPEFQASGPTIGLGPGDPPTIIRRYGAVRFALDPCADVDTSSRGDLHRVDLIVSDRPFEQDSEADVAPFQTLPADARHFRLSWNLRFDGARCDAP